MTSGEHVKILVVETYSTDLRWWHRERRLMVVSGSFARISK
jgi:hypothetical protein